MPHHLSLWSHTTSVSRREIIAVWCNVKEALHFEIRSNRGFAKTHESRVKKTLLPGFRFLSIASLSCFRGGFPPKVATFTSNMASGNQNLPLPLRDTFVVVCSYIHSHQESRHLSGNFVLHSYSGVFPILIRCCCCCCCCLHQILKVVLSTQFYQPSQRVCPYSLSLRYTDYVATEAETEEYQTVKIISNPSVKQVKCQRTAYDNTTNNMIDKQKSRTKRQYKTKTKTNLNLNRTHTTQRLQKGCQTEIIRTQEGQISAARTKQDEGEGDTGTRL